MLENEVRKGNEFHEPSVREILSEFLKKLIIATGQKGQRELDTVIAEEIRKLDVHAASVPSEDEETELLEFKTKVEKWCSDKREKMTATMFRNWLQEAKSKPRSSFVRCLFQSYTKEFFRTGIHFSDRETSRLQAELSNNRAVHLRSDALTLCSILLLDCLPQSKCIFVTFESLQDYKDMLLHAWLGGLWEWLTVFCDSTVQQTDISDTCLTISGITKRAPSTKRLIILTAFSVQQINNFVPIEHKFKFEQLSAESQEKVLDKKIEFQVCEVTLRSVLQLHGNVQHVLGPELVTDLTTKETVVNIGGRLQKRESNYAPRELQRCIWLHCDVLQNSNDVFAVSGTTREDLLKILPSGKTVECVWSEKFNMGDFTQDTSRRIFLLSEKYPENTFLAICEKLEGNTLHWVELKNGELLWKKSMCGTETLLDHIDSEKTRANRRIIAECLKSGICEVNEEAIWDLGERTVLVVDEPDMGKSSTTTQVAWHTKLADPTSLVVRINWNDHTTKLKPISASTFNFDSLVEFLCSAAFPESKYTDINRILLRQALQYSGNVTVLMDGFDEISPIHADKVAVILSELIKTKVGRVWVTSRPVEKDILENELSVIAWNMKNLSRESQQQMFLNIWMCKECEKNFEMADFINRLLLLLNYSVRDENFTGSPLYIKMAATALKMDMISHLNSDDWFWSKIDLINLYEEIFDRKLLTYLTDKQKADITDPIVLYNYEYLTQKYLDDFE